MMKKTEQKNATEIDDCFLFNEDTPEDNDQDIHMIILNEMTLKTL